MTIAKSVIAATGIFVAASFTPLTAMSQTLCPLRSAALSILAISHDEHPLLIGDSERGIVEIFSSPNGETFTVLVTTQSPRGIRSCVIAAGDKLRHVPFAPGDPS